MPLHFAVFNFRKNWPIVMKFQYGVSIKIWSTSLCFESSRGIVYSFFFQGHLNNFNISLSNILLNISFKISDVVNNEI